MKRFSMKQELLNVVLIDIYNTNNKRQFVITLVVRYLNIMRTPEDIDLYFVNSRTKFLNKFIYLNIFCRLAYIRIIFMVKR